MTERKGKLYIIPTPIGNLRDITLRALDALEASDAVYAEDTRVTSKLLGLLGVSVPVNRLDENTMAKNANMVIDRVRAGDVVSYCSDAGMPGVSDPGGRLIAAAREADVPVEVLPGASAAVTAYVASGFLNTSYYFGGFFPRKQGEQQRLLESIAQLDAALVFYESPHRLVAALRALAEAFPHRRAAVCRELTKVHEEVAIDQLPVLAEAFAKRETAEGIRGEIVIVVEGPVEAEAAEQAKGDADSARILARRLLDAGERPKEVAKRIASEFSISRNDAYDLTLEVRDS